MLKQSIDVTVWYAYRIDGLERIRYQLKSFADQGVAVVRIGFVAGEDHARFVQEELQSEGLETRIEREGFRAVVHVILPLPQTGVVLEDVAHCVIDVFWNISSGFR